MSRFDQTIADRFLVAIRAGASDDVAANHAGVELATVRGWMDSGTGKGAKLLIDVRKARADLELLLVGTVRRLSAEDANNAKWLAERVRGDAELERLRQLTT
jgi:transposase